MVAWVNDASCGRLFNDGCHDKRGGEKGLYYPSMRRQTHVAAKGCYEYFVGPKSRVGFVGVSIRGPPWGHVVELNDVFCVDSFESMRSFSWSERAVRQNRAQDRYDDRVPLETSIRWIEGGPQSEGC